MEVVLERHRRAEYLHDSSALIADVEERYRLTEGDLCDRVEGHHPELGPYENADDFAESYDYAFAEGVLLELPDEEFLTAYEHAAATLALTEVFGLKTFIDGALRSHGAAFRCTFGSIRLTFEWVGDPAQHALTVRPALLALADPRLTGARAEFEEALAKRRLGAPKDLEDALDEAAKSVESTLAVLHHEHGVALPARQQITPLFNTLVSAQILPGYVDKLIAAPAGPRNHMASHGQGSAVREVPAELAGASIAAAATAITFLAHYLP